MDDLAVVLLAAGGSTRMGGEHKLLLAWGAGTVVGQALLAALGAPVSAVVVVTGACAGAVEQACRPVDDARVRFMRNPRWQEGMYGSVLAGVAALPPSTQAFFLALGDMPLVPPAVYQQAAAMYRSAPGHIVVPTWEGRRGHPVLFPVALLATAAPEAPDQGLRAVLRRYPERVREMPVAAPGVCIDLDTPEEYAKYLAEAGINPAPEV
jgi:molybdenum cofactor cytidylyltransferase